MFEMPAIGHIICMQTNSTIAQIQAARALIKELNRQLDALEHQLKTPSASALQADHTMYCSLAFASQSWMNPLRELSAPSQRKSLRVGKLHEIES
jgi:hypothetical protein